MYLATRSIQSKIQFGGYDQRIIDASRAEGNSAKGDGIYWMDINSRFYWQVKLFSAKFGDVDIKITNPEKMDIIFDTGTSLIFVPTKEYLQIMGEIYKTKECYKNV